MPTIRTSHPRRQPRPTVLVLSHNAALGGMGRAAQFFTPVLESHCEVVAVVLLSADRAGSDRFEASWSAKLRATVKAAWRCTHVLVTRSPDALYLPISQWGLPLLRDVILALLAKVTGCAPVLHLHGAQLPSRLASNRALRTALARCHWLVLSEEIAAELHASGCRTRSVTVIRNPAPQDIAPRRPREATDGLRIGWLGTMCRAKGFDILCRSVGRMKSAGAPLTFSVAGIRHDVPVSQPACVDEDLGVLEPADVPSFWSGVDVFVLPARWVEGLPFVLLEALQTGCAVAATRSPGCAELFGHGCLAPVDSTVDSVTAFLEACLADSEGIRSRQQKAWEEVRPLYGPERVAESFARFWQHVSL